MSIIDKSDWTDQPAGTIYADGNPHAIGGWTTESYPACNPYPIFTYKTAGQAAHPSGLGSSGHTVPVRPGQSRVLETVQGGFGDTWRAQAPFSNNSLFVDGFHVFHGFSIYVPSWTFPNPTWNFYAIMEWFGNGFVFPQAASMVSDGSSTQWAIRRKGVNKGFVNRDFDVWHDFIEELQLGNSGFYRVWHRTVDNLGNASAWVKVVDDVGPVTDSNGGIPHPVFLNYTDVNSPPGNHTLFRGTHVMATTFAEAEAVINGSGTVVSGIPGDMTAPTVNSVTRNANGTFTVSFTVTRPANFNTSTDRYFLYDDTTGTGQLLNGASPAAAETFTYTFASTLANTIRKVRVSAGQPDGSGNILSSRDGGWSPTSNVDLSVSAGTPTVQLAPTSLSFSLVEGGPDSATQSFVVSFINPGANTNWTIGAVSGYTITPTSGSNGATVTVKSLSSGKVNASSPYSATLTVTPADTNAAPVALPLTTIVGPVDQSTTYPGWVTVIASRDPNTQTANYTLTRQDYDRVIEMNVASANTLTVPTNATVAFPIGTELEITQLGAGQTTLTPAAGVTFRSDGGKTKIAGQYGTVVLRKRATDEWVLAGDLST